MLQGILIDFDRNNPDADFHNVVAEMTGSIAARAKATNFAKIYGVGVRKMAVMIGKPLDAGAGYRQPIRCQAAVRGGLSTICQEKASRVGYTVLYDGARRHWNLWEAPRIFAKGAGPCEIEEARRRIADPTTPGTASGYLAPTPTPRSMR